MDRLVNHLFVFEGEGIIRDFPGNYSQFRETVKEPDTRQPTIKAQKTPEVNTLVPSKKKLSYKEQREFELLEKQIPQLEKERQELFDSLNQPDVPYEQIQKLTDRVSRLSTEINEKEMRWLELSENTL
jgi:ATP-binding cassette subfamily F protein uup